MNKFFRFLFFLFTFSIIIFILYETFGHRWIQAVYSGHSTPFFNTFIREQHIHTLPFYIKKADHFFFSFLLTLNVLVILSYFSFFRYAALMIIFIFSTLEISLRFLEPRLPAIYRNDPELGIQVKPFQLGSNHLGFNDEESSFKKNPSILRVLALGDSFNWAGGYEKNYWTLAEKILNLSDTKKYVEILNQGTPMTGPAYELELLKKVGILFDPDIVLLAFFVGNDFSDSFQDRDHILISRFGYPCNTLRTGKRSFPYVNLQTDSYLWFFAEHKGKELINNLQKKKK